MSDKGIKYDYNAKAADRKYRERLVYARSGVDLSQKIVFTQSKRQSANCLFDYIS